MDGVKGDTGDYAWIMASTALVFMMVPGIALFYSGLRRESSALSLIFLNMMVMSVVTIQWFLFGYSLAFSHNPQTQYIGNFEYAVFLGTSTGDSIASLKSPEIPSMVFGLFQGMFAAFTACLITGVVAEKGRLFPFVVFSFFWTTFVYDPIAYWTWNEGGWANKLGALDWAGGTPVHISSGAGSLAYALMLRYIRTHWPVNVERGTKWWKRLYVARSRNSVARLLPPRELFLDSHNMTNVLLGMMLVWFGWFGFNAGSELHANIRAASTFIASNMAATSGAVTYTLLENTKKQKWSGVGFCTGAFAGLVAITPAAGYVPAWAGLVIGPTASIVCFYVTYIPYLKWYLEEPLDIFIVHGVGGLWGMFMTGLFTDNAVAALDGQILDGGALLNRKGIQIGYQLAGGIAGFVYSFVVTFVILAIMQILSIWIPNLELRRTKGNESAKVDNELQDPEAYRISCRVHGQASDEHANGVVGGEDMELNETNGENGHARGG